jgi:hypothetical protein
MHLIALSLAVVRFVLELKYQNVVHKEVVFQRSVSRCKFYIHVGR